MFKRIPSTKVPLLFSSALAYLVITKIIRQSFHYWQWIFLYPSSLLQANLWPLKKELLSWGEEFIHPMIFQTSSSSIIINAQLLEVQNIHNYS